MTDLLTSDAVVAGHRIACGRQGAGEPLVLIHGTPSHSFIWRDVAPALTAGGLAVHLFDLLGFGRSERPLEADTSVAGQGAVLEGLLDLWRLESVHLVAHDIGGAVALRFAVARPERVRSLTLIDSVSYDSWPSATWREIIRRHLQTYAAMPAEEFRALLTRQLRMTVFDKSRMAGDVLEAYLAPLAGPLGQTSFFTHQVRHYDSRYTEDITPALGGLKMPVQILWGAEDEWQPVAYGRRLAADIPGARLEVIPEAGHFLMEDAPDAVANLVLSFVAQERAGGLPCPNPP